MKNKIIEENKPIIKSSSKQFLLKTKTKIKIALKHISNVNLGLTINLEIIENICFII